MECNHVTHRGLCFGKVHVSIEKNSYILVPCLKGYRKCRTAILKKEREREIMRICPSRTFLKVQQPLNVEREQNASPVIQPAKTVSKTFIIIGKICFLFCEAMQCSGCLLNEGAGLLQEHRDHKNTK